MFHNVILNCFTLFFLIILLVNGMVGHLDLCLFTAVLCNVFRLIVMLRTFKDGILKRFTLHLEVVHDCLQTEKIFFTSYRPLSLRNIWPDLTQ